MSRAQACRCAALATALGTALISITILRTSLTDDEPYCYDYGRRIVFEGRFDRRVAIDDSKLPVLALNALPERIGTALGFDRSAVDPLLHRLPLTAREREYIHTNLPIYAGRTVTIGCYLIVCLLVFCWGMEVYGPAGALGATVLIAFLPTLIGHAGLVTTDAAATCTIFAAVYALTRCYWDPTIERALVAGVACGVALLVKYSAIDLAPIAALLIVARTVAVEPMESRRRAAQASVTSSAIVVVAAIVTISVGFGLQHPITRLSDLSCESRSLLQLRQWVGTVPLPLPREFLTGLDRVLLHDQGRSGGGLVYLLGTLTAHGRPSYYLVATLLKTPVPFLALVLIRPWRRHRRYSDWAWLIAVAVFAAHMSFSLQSQVGLRYLLPAFPFLAMLAGAAWDHGRTRRWRQLATVLAGLCVIDATANCPRYLSYFNQLIGTRQNAYRYLADSNLDWDQGRFALWRWEAQQTRPYVLEPKYVPRAGLVAVRATEFVGVFDPETYRWLRDAVENGQARLVMTVGDAFLVFDVASSVETGNSSPGERGSSSRRTNLLGGLGGTDQSCRHSQTKERA